MDPRAERMLDRGEYDVEFFTPTDEYFDIMLTNSLPRLVVISSDLAGEREVVETMIGPWTEEKLEETILDLMGS